MSEPFCRALSTAGLPECREPAGHEGAHVFGHFPAEELLGRCAVMLREGTRLALWAELTDRLLWPEES